jgi:hypothetical protein
MDEVIFGIAPDDSEAISHGGRAARCIAMTTATAPAVADRIAELDWPALTARIDEDGFVQTPPVYTAGECRELAASFEDGRFRSTIDMRRYRFGEGGHNTLHQDIYGEVAFPLQAVTVLDRPGQDFEGGQFVLLEQRPRAQSRAHVVDLRRGAFLIFATRHRPVQGTRGYYRANMRHGVATVHSGQRTTLGVIFHDAA